MQYEVQVKVAASCGGTGQITNVPVEASHEAGAIVAATLKLDAKGIDRFELVRVVPTSN